MISDTVTSKGTAAITSDQWHVVHSRFGGRGSGAQAFGRVIVSEHDDRTVCRDAARVLRDSLVHDAQVPLVERDEVFARPPHFKSLKATRRRRVTNE